MSLNGHDLSVKESGWYEKGIKVGEMKNHNK